MPELIERVRVGSHREFVPRINYETGEPDKEGRGYHQTVEEYETVYRDCLVPGDWVKEHEHDLDNYEPTIEITVDGKALSVNGNYKQGMIAGFMVAYTTKAKMRFTDLRTGKRRVKSVNLDVGIADKINV